MTLAEFLARIKSANAAGKHRNRIQTADLYVSTLGKCAGGLCPTDRARYTGPEFEKRVKEAGQTPVYSNDLMGFMGFSKSAKVKDADGTELAPVAVFDAVYTSKKQDRDSDILEPKGAEIDPRMPLLWQHDPTAPIGKHVKTLGQTDTSATGQCAIADIPLGRDAAYLAEFGALRLSHGFRPKEFEPITQKSGGVEELVGFHVLKYEMMEISLVSVPSNTDAVITGLSRGKLTSGLAKSWAMSIDARRRKFYRTGLDLPAMKRATVLKSIPTATATGKKPAKAFAKKSLDDMAQALAEVCSKFVHSGDYGLCFAKPADADAATASVWWTMGDADTGSAEDGTPMTTADEIKAALGAVPGVSDVTVESETNPPFDEGWSEVYPDVKDWTSAGADAGDSAQSSEPAPTDPTDPGKRGRPAPKSAPKPAKADAPVAGSFEGIAQAIGAVAQQYLTDNGVEVPDGMGVNVEATFADSVILEVGTGEDPDDDTNSTFYRVSYSTDASGAPALSGAPELVQLQMSVADAPANNTPTDGNGSGASQDATPPASGTSDGGAAPSATSAKPAPKNGKPLAKWVPVPARKGKVGKKDMGLLKEAVEHLDDAMKRDGMPTVCKTLVKRGMDLVGDVIKSDGQSDPADPTGTDGIGADGLSGPARAIWAQVKMALKNPKQKRLVLAFLFEQLAAQLSAEDVTAELQALGANWPRRGSDL